MVRRLILGAAALIAGCASITREGVDGVVRAHIAEDVELSLPTPPAYPEARTISQIVSAQYEDRSAAFEAILSLAPDETVIVVTAVGGPRIATITWNEDGVRELRTALAPSGVPVENILADIFLVRWPTDAVRAALPDGLELVTDDAGGRVVRRGEEVIVAISPDIANPGRIMVRNLAFGYELTIISQDFG